MNAAFFLYIVAFVLGAAVTIGATPLVIRLASHLGVTDTVGEERRMHTQPKPRIGGLGVFLGFAFALFVVLGLALTHPHLFAIGPVYHHGALGKYLEEVQDWLEASHNLIGLLFGSMLILGVGVWDDILNMRPRNKFVAQIVVALVSMLYGFTINGTYDPFHSGAHQWIAFPWWVSVPLTLVWYVGMMNALNFIDGLDGLLSGVAAISCGTLFIIALHFGDSLTALVVAALAGAALGFLPYNFNPAQIILGDAGSLFIGYVFATVTMFGTGQGKRALAISILVPLVILALPILDTAAAIVRRTLTGKSITEADRGHFHHQLIYRFGLDVRQAVLLIYALCVLLGVVALALSGIRIR